MAEENKNIEEAVETLARMEERTEGAGDTHTWPRIQEYRTQQTEEVAINSQRTEQGRRRYNRMIEESNNHVLSHNKEARIECRKRINGKPMILRKVPYYQVDKAMRWIISDGIEDEIFEILRKRRDNQNNGRDMEKDNANREEEKITENDSQ